MKFIEYCRQIKMFALHSDVKKMETEARERLSKKLPDNQKWFAESANFLLQQNATSCDVNALIEAEILCVRYFYTARDRQVAIAIGEHALRMSVQSALPSQEQVICNWMGILQKDSGKFVVATEYFVRGIGIARRIPDRECEAKAWANMASLVNMMGLYDDAIKFARRALALVAGKDTEPSQLVRGGACQIIARASQALGRFEEALASIRHAAHQMPVPRSAFDYLMRVRLGHTHTVIALRLNELDEARDVAAAAAEDAIHCVGPEAAIQSSVAAAMVDARAGNHKSADATTQRLLKDYANDSTLVFDLYFARLYVLEQAKRMEEAEDLRSRFRDEWQDHKMKNVIAQLRTLDDAATHDTQDSSDAAIRERLEELAIIGELHDDSTGEHAFRVGRLSGLLALRIGLSQEHADALDIAARLHDIGKITTPPEILMKPGRLDDKEWKVMEEHAAQGHKILSTRKDPLMEMAAQVALSHHERWDGGGYPNKLKGNEIPQIAQIAALADVFDALSHERCYKPAWSINASLAEIERTSRGYGRQDFETKLADEFIKLVRDLVDEHGEDGLDPYLSERASESAFRNARAAAGNTLDAAQLGAVTLRLVGGTESANV
jgi:putative two-component system response regulator